MEEGLKRSTRRYRRWLEPEQHVQNSRYRRWLEPVEHPDLARAPCSADPQPEEHVENTTQHDHVSLDSHVFPRRTVNRWTSDSATCDDQIFQNQENSRSLQLSVDNSCGEAVSVDSFCIQSDGVNCRIDGNMDDSCVDDKSFAYEDHETQLQKCTTCNSVEIDTSCSPHRYHTQHSGEIKTMAFTFEEGPDNLDCAENSDEDQLNHQHEHVEQDVGFQNEFEEQSDDGLDDNGYIQPNVQQENGQHIHGNEDHSDDEEVGDSDHESEVSDDDQAAWDDVYNLPLNNNVRTTVAEALLLILTFGMRYSLSSSALIGLIELINHIFAQPVLNTAKNVFEKVFGSKSLKLKYHFYCLHCTALVTSIYEHNQENVDCPNCGMPCSVGKLTESNFFITASLGPQIKALFERADVQDHLQYPNTRVKSNPAFIEDIYDGEFYRNLSKPGGPLHNSDNFTYSFNSDGLPVFSKAKCSLWPIFVMLNELPVKMRRDNMILAGLWCGKTEPNMELFLDQFVKEGYSLATEGIQWERNGIAVHSKLYGICCVVDAPARAMMRNTMRFNGYFGCGCCYHPGKSVNRVVKYPVDVCEYDDRKDDEMVQDMIQAVEENRIIRGVKGVSVLINMPFFPVVWGFPPDFMHCVLLGVVRQLTDLWFSGVADQPYYIGSPNNMAVLDQQISQLRPASITYKNLKLLSERAYWKAADWYNWLLFFSLPCLNGILPPVFFMHFMLLVEAMYLLLQKSISLDDVNRADELLLEFVVHMQQLYGDACMTFNVHTLTHLAKTVKIWGPLWAISCFPFEGANWSIKRMLHGNRGVILQALHKFVWLKTLSSVSKLETISYPVQAACEQILDSRKPVVTDVVDGMNLFGKGVAMILSEEEKIAFYTEGVMIPNRVTMYCRMGHQGFYYYSIQYKRQQNTNNSVFCLSDGSIGILQKVIISGDRCYVIYKQILVSDQPVFCRGRACTSAVSHIKLCTDFPTELHVASAHDLKGNCMLIETPTDNYVTFFPNHCAVY